MLKKIEIENNLKQEIIQRLNRKGNAKILIGCIKQKLNKKQIQIITDNPNMCIKYIDNWFIDSIKSTMQIHYTVSNESLNWLFICLVGILDKNNNILSLRTQSPIIKTKDRNITIELY
jgi:hypothetical protein